MPRSSAERDVRERAERDERRLRRHVLERGSRRRAAATGSEARGGQLGPVEAALAVHVRGDVQLADAAAGRRPAATGTSPRPTSASTRSALSVVFSSVWLPCTVVTPTRSTSGLASASRSAIASSWPGVAVDDDRGVIARSIASTSAAVGRDGCAPKREAASAPAAQARPQRLLALAALEQRDEQAGGERVAGGSAVDGVDLRRLGTRDLLAVLEQDRALGAERERDEAVAAPERLELVAVDDGEVGVDVDRPRGRRVQAEEPRRLLPGAADGLVRDLELREDGVAGASSTVAELRVRARRDRDLVLAARVDEDQRDAGRRLDAARARA